MTSPRLTSRPTHNLTLSDGVTTLGLTLCDPRGTPDVRAIREVPMPKTSMQIAQGDPTYGNFQLPFSAIVQKDWSGGRGWLDFNKDSTRFYDSEGIDTRMGDMILGPKATRSIAITRSGGLNTPGTTYLSTAHTRIASHYVAAAPLDVARVRFKLKIQHTYTTAFWAAEIWSDVAGSPGVKLNPNNVVKTLNYNIENFTIVDFYIDPAYTLTAGVHYWIVLNIFGTQPPGAGHTLTYYIAPGAGNAIKSWDGAAWVTDLADYQLYAETFAPFEGSKLFFEYRNNLMAITQPEDGSAPKLYVNGVHGMAKANTNQLGLLLTDIDLTAVGNLGGYVIQLVSGAGTEEKINWRTITYNTNLANGNQIAVDRPWLATHGADTEFVVLGLDMWTEITGHGLTLQATAVLPVGEHLYFAQGERTAMRRAKYNLAGSMTDPAQWSFAAESDIDATYKGATFLAHITDSTGKRKVWYAQSTTCKVASSDVPAWGTPLSFGTYADAIVCGNTRTRITNMIPYGNPQVPWILKEDCFGSISAGFFAVVPLAELSAARADNNGQAATAWGVYLFFSLMDGLERFLDNRLDDLGPNRDEGLPLRRQGPIVDVLPYPGGLYAAINTGEGQDSSIMYWNQVGWHEVYRANGDAITDLFIQVIPGRLRRLWFAMGDEVWWLPLSTNPRKSDEYEFASTGSLITSWVASGFGEINKYWSSLTLHTEDLLTTVREVIAYYQTDAEDDNDAWHLIGTFNTSPSQKIALSTTHNVTGRRIRFKLVFSSPTGLTSPKLKAITVQTVTRVPPATSWSITVLSASYMQDRQGHWEAVGEAALRAQLDAWANSETQPGPLLMRADDPAYDNRYVFIDPASVLPIKLTTEVGTGRTRIVKAMTFAIFEAED